MLDKNVTTTVANLQETLEFILGCLADAFNYGKKVHLTPEIHDDYLPGETFRIAVYLGWIPKPPPLKTGIYLGNYVVTQEYYDDFRRSLPWSYEYAQYFRERFDPESIMEWVQPTPDSHFQKFKDLSDLNEEEIAARVGCHEKTLQRLKLPGYRTQVPILKALAEFMNKRCPTEFGTITFHDLMWRQRED